MLVLRDQRGGTGQAATLHAPARLLIAAGRGYRVAWRGRSRTPFVGPNGMSRVVRELGWPAMRDTSVASSFQVTRAVVQNTCRRLCQVQSPLPLASRQPAAR